MSLQTRIVDLAKAIGTDVKVLEVHQGDLNNLSTTAKNNLVNAINEIFTLANDASNVEIDDTATNGDTDVVWSADKVHDELLTSINNLRSELTSGASEALDTFAELAAAMDNDPNFATTIANGLAKRVRVDAAQNFTTSEKLQACENIGVGDPNHDFVAEYNSGKVQ